SLVSLPARLNEAGNLPGIAELAQRDTAHPDLAVIGARTAGDLAAVADTDRRRVARQLSQLQLSSETLLEAELAVAGNGLETGALRSHLLHHLLALVVLLD